MCSGRKGIVRFQFQFHIHVSVSDLYISGIGPQFSTYFPAAEQTDQSWEYINRSPTHECGNWDYAAQFLFWEYLFRISGMWLCSVGNNCFVCSKSVETVPVKTRQVSAFILRCMKRKKIVMDLMELLFVKCFNLRYVFIQYRKG